MYICIYVSINIYIYTYYIFVCIYDLFSWNMITKAYCCGRSGERRLGGSVPVLETMVGFVCQIHGLMLSDILNRRNIPYTNNQRFVDCV